MYLYIALETLNRHRVSQLEAKVKTGEFWQEHDCVFCTLQGRRLSPYHVVVEFKKLLTLAGLPNIRFHDLRHNAATLLLVRPSRAGKPPGQGSPDSGGELLPCPSRDAVGEAVRRKLMHHQLRSVYL